MYRTVLHDKLCAYVAAHEKNRVSPEDAIKEDLAGLELWDKPLLGVADAEDPLFLALQSPGVIHEDYPLPSWWLPGARRVLSFFLPFSERIKKSNEVDRNTASPEWLHGRIEGQEMLIQAGLFLCAELEKAGYHAVMPTADRRFALFHSYASNWSERHAAFICGLGTFGASKGLITAKGMAGRFGSIVTDCDVLDITPRQYEGVYEYCRQCSACAAKCPVQAIDLRRGLDQAKSQRICGEYVERNWTPPQGKSRKRRYGCGKCQVGVPCADAIPG